MTKMLLVCGVLVLVLSAGVAQAQTNQSTSVVVGQNAEGRNLIIAVIPLKFLDPALAAQLFGGMALGGTATALPGRVGADYEGARRSGSRSRGYDNYQNSQSGYGGYGQAGQQSQQYPGYQSPYANR